MLNVWLGYDEGNLGRMKQAIGDVTWLYPAVDRFAARLGMLYNAILKHSTSNAWCVRLE